MALKYMRLTADILYKGEHTEKGTPLAVEVEDGTFGTIMAANRAVEIDEETYNAELKAWKRRAKTDEQPQPQV